jgi:hypothetical protein
MMKAAIEADDPVVYLEHKNIWANEGEVDEAEPYVWGTARTRRTGPTSPSSHGPTAPTGRRRRRMIWRRTASRRR